MTRSTSCWWAANVPAARRIASTRVVFPWSTWATSATLRSSAGEDTKERAYRGASLAPLSVLLVVDFLDDILVEAPRRVFNARFRSALRAWLHLLREPDGVELEGP